MSLRLRVSHQFAVHRDDRPELGPWKVSTSGYLYAVDFADGRELLSYHWNRDLTAASFPHLHLSAGAQVGEKLLQRAHIVTARVAVEDVLQFLVDELGVKPLRTDWRDLLAESRAAFHRWRTWG